MYEHNTDFFSVGKSSVVTGIINQLIQKKLFPYEDSDEEITTRLFSKDFFYAIWS